MIRAHLAHASDTGEGKVPLQKPCDPLLAIEFDDKIQAEQDDGAYLRPRL